MCAASVVGDVSGSNEAEWVFVLDNMSTIQAQAKRCNRKLGCARTYYSYDDLLQEGVVKVKETASRFRSSRGRSKSYVSTVVGNHLLSILKKAITLHSREGTNRYGRDVMCLYTAENDVEKFHRIPSKRPVYIRDRFGFLGYSSPRVHQKRWMQFSDIHIAIPLSFDAYAFCKCLLDPPEELRIILSNQAVGTSSWKNSVDKLICNRLAIHKNSYPLITAEIREKCELEI